MVVDLAIVWVATPERSYPLRPRRLSDARAVGRLHTNLTDHRVLSPCCMRCGALPLHGSALPCAVASDCSLVADRALVRSFWSSAEGSFPRRSRSNSETSLAPMLFAQIIEVVVNLCKGIGVMLGAAKIALLVCERLRSSAHQNSLGN